MEEDALIYRAPSMKLRSKLRAVYRDALFRNSLYLFLTTVTMGFIGFIFWIIVAHFYRPSQVGIASSPRAWRTR